jgi:hypothetical protein
MPAKRRKKRRKITRASLEKKMLRISDAMRPGLPRETMSKLEKEYGKVEREWSKKLNEERRAFDKHMGYK